MPCWSISGCSSVLVNLETDRSDLRATEESEYNSTPVAGGGGEAGMFCAGENVTVSQFKGYPAAG